MINNTSKIERMCVKDKPSPAEGLSTILKFNDTIEISAFWLDVGENC